MKIEHVALYVKNLEGAKDFFVKHFGGVSGEMYHNPKTGFSSYFISFEDGARLELMNKADVNEASQKQCLGFAHLAFSAGSRERVDELTAVLQNAGYEITSGPRVTGDGYYESCVKAFEDNIVEITV